MYTYMIVFNSLFYSFFVLFHARKNFSYMAWPDQIGLCAFVAVHVVLYVHAYYLPTILDFPGKSGKTAVFTGILGSH